MRTAWIVLSIVMAAGCEQSGGPRASSAGAAAGPSSAESPGNPVKLDPLVGRWILDAAQSSADGSSSKSPAEVLGETLLIARDGQITIVESSRRGTWRHVTDGVRISLDAPPRAFTAQFVSRVTERELQLTGPGGLRLIYRRDTLRSPRPADARGNEDARR